MNKNKYLYLELLRFAAAAIIVIHHFYWFSNDGRRPTFMLYDNLDGIVPPYVAPIIRYGMYAVNFFWLLSGFIFFAQYEKKISGGQISGRSFAVLRLSRLYPLHIATMILVAIVQTGYASVQSRGEWLAFGNAGPLDYVTHILMMSGWDQTRQSTLNVPIWSVSLEIVVYAVFFIVAIRSRKALTIAVALSIPLLVLYGAWDRQVNILEAIGLFFLGGLAYRFIAWFRSTNRDSLKRISTLVLALTTVIATAGVYIAAAPMRGIDGNVETLLYITMFGVTALAALIKQPTDLFGRIFEHLGSLTYASYLIHMPIYVTFAWVLTAMGYGNLWELP